MNFTIENNPNYAVIKPTVEIIDAEILKAISDQIDNITTNDENNFIIDLQNVLDIDGEFNDLLLQLHNSIYEREGSIVITHVQDIVLQKFKQAQLHLSINITPTFEEAIDIINMEMLERDLMKEEE